MKISKLIATGSVIAAAVAIAGCDVEQTEEGKMPDVEVSGDAGNMPEYEVIKTEEGRLPEVDVDVSEGNMPEYDVDGPDVEVGARTVDVEVPTVDVDLPDESDKDKQ